MKRLLLLASLSLPILTFAPRVFAQDVSDADKNAARQLFVEGDTLQKQSRFAEALDKFERSARVFHAPTTMLRIAQCNVALGRLVEADETYRETARFELRADASSAFQAAKAQAATEGGALSPRVPALRVDVTPPGIRGVVVTIDDQPLNEALMGVARPLNPGTHRVTATAAGYSRAEQVVTVRERQKDAAVSLQLFPATQATQIQGPGPIPVGPGPLPVQTNPNQQGNPNVTNPNGTAPNNMYVPPQKKVSETSFFYGARLGYQATLDTSGNPFAGWGIGGELAVRFAKYVTLSTVLDLGRVSYNGNVNDASRFASNRTFVRAAAYAGYISAADAPIGVWAQLGAAARYEGGDVGETGGGGTSVALSIGMPIKISTVRIVPRVDIDPVHSVAFIGVSGLIEVGGKTR